MSICFFFLMIRRPPRSTLDRSSAASDVYKRQGLTSYGKHEGSSSLDLMSQAAQLAITDAGLKRSEIDGIPVSYTHLRAHETVLDLVCRLLLEKKKQQTPEP